jgi:hypothetical protein
MVSKLSGNGRDKFPSMTDVTAAPREEEAGPKALLLMVPPGDRASNC